MDPSLQLLKRIQTCADAGPACSADEMQSLLSSLHAAFEQAEAEAKELREAQAEAIVTSAMVIAELEETQEELRDSLQATIEARDELKRVERDLIKAREIAERASQTKSEFLANMSHEIRTPLNGILGFADLLIEHGTQFDEAQRVDYLSCIRTSGRHLLELINDILDLSKIEADHLELEYLDYSPNDLLAEVASLLGVRAAGKGIELTCRWEGPVPRTIRTDPTRLRQTLMNLTGNAIKFTQQGGVQLIGRVRPTENGRFQLQVDVVDTGIGIPGDKLDAIFMQFSQADNSVTRRFGGSGLGLCISRQLARALGGDVTVESEVGAGSCFTLTVDAGLLADTVMLEQSATGMLGASCRTPEPSGPSVDLSGVHVLIAEDGLINQKLISALLRQAGATSDLAENGAVAVGKTQKSRYDVILMDMQMPVLDGYAATKALRGLGDSTPIIALTAHAMNGDREKCLQAGCSDYVSKPIDVDDLLKTIAAYLPGKAQDSSASNEQSVSGPVSAARPTNAITSTLPGDPVFQEIVRDFGSMLDRYLPRMRDAAVGRDFSALKKLTHDLVGTAGSAGFGDFTEPARRLEYLIDSRQHDEIPQSLRLLEELAMRVEIPGEAVATALSGASGKELRNGLREHRQQNY